MKKIIIFGVNNFAELMCYNLINSGYSVEAFTVNKKYITNNMFYNRIIVPFENIEMYYPSDKYAFCLCMGYKHMNTVRENIFNQIKDKGYEVINYIHPTAYVNNAALGEGNIVLEQSLLGFNVIIGNGNIIYPKAQVAHHTKMGNFNFCAISSSIAGSCVIENYCFFGNGSCTKNGLHFGNKTLIGAGTYVSNDTDENSVIVQSKSYKLDKESTYFL